MYGSRGRLVKLRGLLARLLRNERGNVLILVAAGLPFTIGAAAMTTDMIQWTLWKRELQRQADSGAMAGAYALSQSKTVNSSVTTDLAKNADPTLTVTSTIENAPTAGSYAGNTKAVRVILQTSRKLPFSSVFLSTAPTVKVEATAAIVAAGQYCVVALENTASVGISIGGNATVNLGCGMIANSTGTNTIDAVNAYGSAAVTASPVAAVGDLSPDSHFASGTTFLPYSPPQADPFATLPNPTSTDFTSCNNKLSVGPQDNVTIPAPASGKTCYRGMDIKGTLTLGAGVYFIDGDSVKINSGAVINGTGVTIVLTSSSAATSPSSVATIDINGGATLNLSAPTSGTYAGVLLYQDRRADDSGTEKINGNATTFLQGSIYMPSRQVQFTGTSGMSTNCLQIVARRVIFSGNSAVNNSCPSGSGASSFSGTRVRLVA
jgi:Flp pilus assembly protein TadG